METSATTNLKFILARPEEDTPIVPPNTDGDNTNNNTNTNTNTNGSSTNTGGTNTITGTGTTTTLIDDGTVPVPNTGAYSFSPRTGSPSQGSPITPILVGIFIAIALIIAARAIIKQKKSHLKFSSSNFGLNARPMRYATIAVATLLVAFIGSSIFGRVYSENERSAKAAGSSLSISSLGTIEEKINSNFDIPDLGYAVADIVTVTSTSEYDYHVTMKADSDKLYLDGKDTSEDYFKPVTGSAEGNLHNQDGSWGYHTVQNFGKDCLEGSSASQGVMNCKLVTWSAVPTTDTKIADSPAVAAGENNSSETEVYFGVNPSDNLKNGTYSTKIVYTVISDEPPAPTGYTISYDGNGGTGEAGKTTENVEEGSTITLPAKNTLAKEGYNFLGWALTNDATAATYTAEGTVSLADLITAAAAAGQTTTIGSTITLYAVWEKEIAYMQSTACSALALGETGTLVDARDEQAYNVYRWPTTGTAGTDYPTDMSGFCIMTQDLSLGYVTGGSITKDADLALTAEDSAAAGTITARTGTSDWGATDNTNANLQYINGPSAADNEVSKHSYYSYGAALAVCPKGWRLPTSAEYANIVALVGEDTAAGSTAIQAAPYLFTYGGSFSTTGWSEQGEYGRYWAADSASTGNTGPVLSFNASSLNISSSADKNQGKSVRCIAEYIPTMQDTQVGSLPEGATTTLIDTRDNQTYGVYRWPSTGTAGSDYPTDMAGYAIMTKDLSLGYVTGGSITKDADLTLTAETSAAAGTILARTDLSTWADSNTDDNLQYTNGPKTGQETHTSHSYYSYGAAQAACPKGWRLPTIAEYDNIVAFLGGSAATAIIAAPYEFVYGGTVQPGDFSANIGAGGHYWSSTVADESMGRDLRLSADNVQKESSNKGFGLSVRCIAAPTTETNP